MHLAEKSSALKDTTAEGGEPQLEDNRRGKKALGFSVSDGWVLKVVFLRSSFFRERPSSDVFVSTNKAFFSLSQFRVFMHGNLKIPGRNKHFGSKLESDFDVTVATPKMRLYFSGN